MALQKDSTVDMLTKNSQECLSGIFLYYMHVYLHGEETAVSALSCALGLSAHLICLLCLSHAVQIS